MGGRYGDETLDSVKASESLDVVAADDAAHAVAYYVDRLFGLKCLRNIIRELLG